MFYYDNKEHHLPHIHIEFAEFKAVVSLLDSNIIAGNFPNEKFKLVSAWMLIHRDELMANWKLALEGQTVFKIEALK